MTQNSSGLSIPIPVTQGGTNSTTAAGALTNLGALPIAGGTMTGFLTLNADPTTALQAATKQYADAIASGLVIKQACYASTTANLVVTQAGAGIGATLTEVGNGAFTTDGTTPPLNARILVQFQTLTQHNGIYVLNDQGSAGTPYQLTRATDFDTPAEIPVGALVIVNNGTLYQTTSWIQTDTVTVVDTDPVEFSQFTAGVGANTSLSNLITTSINQSLIPDADGTHILGDNVTRWGALFTEAVVAGTIGGNTLDLQAWDSGLGSFVSFLQLTSGNPATADLVSSVTATTQAPGNNTTKLATTAFVTAADTALGLLKANVTLNNLTTTAINADLLPDSTNLRSLGSSSNIWNSIYTGGVGTSTVDGDTTFISAFNGVSYTHFITLTAHNPGPATAVLDGAITSVTQAPLDNSTKLATTAYVDAATGGGSGANVHLSNLSGVAINTALLPGVDNTIDLGDGTHRFRELFGSRVSPGSVSGNTLILSARNVGGASDTPFLTLTSDTTTPTAVLASGVTGTTQAANDNSAKLATTAYADAAAAARANVALSNLSGVAINTSLLPASDNAIDLGDGTHRWRQLFGAKISTGTTSGNTLVLSGRNVGGSSDTAFFTITADATTPTAVLSGAVTGTTQAALDNSTKLATTAYVDAATGGGSGANINLSNLSAVAINTALLPGVDNTIDLGSGTKRFRELYGSRVSPGSVSGNTLILSARNVGGASDTPFLTLTSDTTTPTAVLASGVTATTQANSDNSTKIATTAYVDTRVPIPMTVALGGTGVTTLTTAYGTLVAGTTATGPVQTVSPGSSGAPLVSGGSSALPSYTTLTVAGGGTGVTTLTTAYGVLCAGTTATGAVQTLSALGASGTVLTSNGAGALPSFQAVASTAGAIVFIASAAASSSATIDFAANITSTYDNYLITIENAVPATNAVSFQMRVGTGAGPTYQATNYEGAIGIQYSGGVGAVAAATTFIPLTYDVSRMSNTSTVGAGGVYYLFNANNSSNDKSVVGELMYLDTGTTTRSKGLTGSQWKSSTVLTSLRFLMSSGNISTGTFKLYGIVNS